SIAAMPLGGAISPDGSTFGIASAGYGPHRLNIIDLASEKVMAEVPLTKAWNGIAWSPDSRRVYVGGGLSGGVNDIYVIERASGEWRRGESLKLPVENKVKIMVAGLAVSADGRTLFALNNADGKLYALDP